MGKKLVILIILLIGIIPIGIIGADIALSVSSFNPSDFEVSTGSPALSLADDNTSINYAVNVTTTTPQLGFLPKAVIINFNIYQNNTLIGKPFTKSIPIGTTQINQIEGLIDFTELLTMIISSGTAVTFQVKSALKIAIFGFVIPGVEFNLPDQTFTVP